MSILPNSFTDHRIAPYKNKYPMILCRQSASKPIHPRLKMCFKLFLLATIVVAYVAAAAKDRASDAFSLYPFNNYPYYVEPTPSNNNNADSHRQMLTMSFVIPAVNLPTRLTILETLTSTSTIVCTKSVSNQCSVRRRTQRPWRVNRPALAVANKK